MANKDRLLSLILAFLTIFNSPRSCFANSLWRKVENRAFKVGEKLVYTVKWKGVTGGTSIMEVKKIVKISARDAYYVTLATRSSRFFDLLFKTRDFIETYIDKEGIFSWKWRKRLRGGNYRSDKEAIYDQAKHQGLYKGRKINIPFYVQDSLSSVYYLRTQQLKEGDSLIMDVNDDGNNYTVEVKVTGIEEVNTPCGEFETLKTEVVWRGEKGVAGENSQIWFTNDQRKIPVKIEKQSQSGTITMELKKARL